MMVNEREVADPQNDVQKRLTEEFIQNVEFKKRMEERDFPGWREIVPELPELVHIDLSDAMVWHMDEHIYFRSLRPDALFPPCVARGHQPGCQLRKGTRCYLPAIRKIEWLADLQSKGHKHLPRFDLSGMAIDPRDPWNQWNHYRDPLAMLGRHDPNGDSDWESGWDIGGSCSRLGLRMLSHDEIGDRQASFAGGVFCRMLADAVVYFGDKGVPKEVFDLIKDEVEDEEGGGRVPDHRAFLMRHGSGQHLHPMWCNAWKQYRQSRNRHPGSKWMWEYSDPVAIIKQKLFNLGLNPRDYGFEYGANSPLRAKKVSNPQGPRKVGRFTVKKKDNFTSVVV